MVQTLPAVRLARSWQPIVSNVDVLIAFIPTRQLPTRLEEGATLTTLTIVLTNSRLRIVADRYVQNLLHSRPRGRETNILTAQPMEIL